MSKSSSRAGQLVGTREGSCSHARYSPTQLQYPVVAHACCVVVSAPPPPCPQPSPTSSMRYSQALRSAGTTCSQATAGHGEEVQVRVGLQGGSEARHCARRDSL